MIYSSRTQADELAMVSGPASTELMRRALAIACAALDEPDAERERWAQQQCGDDATLRAEVAALLAADQTPERAFERPLEDLSSSDPWPGRLLGRYRIGARIGSGGMGSVYRAEPESGVTLQPVALKLIKRGMDSEEILRRFLRERDILARLDHPNIARLLDGGMSEDGRPWFAMELVEGEALLDYCDRLRLDLDHRVDLFLQICAAVEYAHSSLIVHRDLKPGNVLVTATGQAKLLDFGIAKLIDADGEAATRSQMAMMTPDYAAPEQYERGPITTQTDVYLLGVTLAELLTGRRPAWPQRAAGALSVEAHLDTVYAARAAADDTALVDLAARRGSSVAGLARGLRGDLDRIARRAMAYEPQRRYASAGALADDLRRYRRGEPVLAMDDTLGYRLGKFVRRHRVVVASLCAVLASLAIGMTATLRESHRSRIAEAHTETTLTLLEDIFLGADPYTARGGDTRASDLLDGARQRIAAEVGLAPALAARLWFKLGMAYVSLDRREAAESALNAAVASGEQALDCHDLECLDADPAATRITVAAARARLAHYQLVIDGDLAALPMLQAAIADLRAAGNPARHALAQALQFLSDHEFNQGHFDDLDALSAESVALERAGSGDDSTDTIMALGNRASLMRAAGRNDRALVAAEEAHRRVSALADAAPPGVRLYIEQQYAGALSDGGRPADAEPVLRAARDRAQALRGADSNLTIGLSWDLAGAESALGQYPLAIAEYRRLLQSMEGQKDANVGAMHNALGNALLGSNDPSSALSAFTTAQGIICATDGGSPPCVAISLNRIDAELTLKYLDRAEQHLRALNAVATAIGARAAMRWHLLDSRLRLLRHDLAGASDALARSRAAVTNAEDVDAIDRAHWLAQQAAILEQSDDRAKALPLLQEAEALYRGRWTGEPTALVEVRAAIGRLQRDLKTQPPG